MDSKLSYEMIMEILSRSSLKTLDTMRCTSKELNKLTYESYLLDSCMKRNNMVSGFLIQNMKRGFTFINKFVPSPESSNLDFGFLPNNARILATSEHGIMLFRTREFKDNVLKYVYNVCKPTTNQVLELPSPNDKYDIVWKFAIVMMSLKPLHYKIIRFSDNFVLERKNKFYTTPCDIFDSAKWEWRPLKRLILPNGVFLTQPQPVTHSGSIYSLLTNNQILKFDVYSERWKIISLRVPVLKDEYDALNPSPELVKYEGRLSLGCKSSNGCWEIWVERIRHQLWKKIDICACKKIEDDVDHESLKAMYDSDTSVMVDFDTLLFYRFKQEGNNMIRRVVLSGIPYQIFSFRSDFEPIDLRC